MSAPTAAAGIGPKPRIWLGALIASTVPAALIWTLTDTLGGHRLDVETAGVAQPVTLFSVVAISVLACVVGLASAGLLARFTRRARTLWLVASPLVLMVSLVGTLSATTVNSMLILVSMHCVVGIPVIAAGRTLAALRLCCGWCADEKGWTVMHRCSPGRRVSAIARPMPVWGGHGPGRLVTLACIPVLMLEPSLAVVGGRDWFAHLLLAAIPALFATATICAYSRHSNERGTVLALTAQTAATILAAALYGPHWYITFTLLALTLGAMAPPPAAPPALLALTLIAPVTVWFRDADWTTTWVTGLTVLLAGFSTYSLHRLLSVATELETTRTELARQAVETERLRFARDLHDLLGHTLSVIVVKAQAVRKVQSTDPDAATDHARDIEHIGRRALTEIREAVAGYRATGVVDELDRAALALAAVDIAMVVEQPPEPMPGWIDELFSWVIREATTNAIRHSGAATVTVTITIDDTVARLTVADDGRGRRGGPRNSGGLEGLRERAIDAQGNLEVTDSPTGFTLTTEVPLWKETVTDRSES